MTLPDPPGLERAILHVDMDAFFASVEQLDDPALRGKPVLVGGAGRRGVVAAASYEARRFGCRSAMPMAIALRRCPDAIVVRGRGERYRAMSDRVMAVLHDCTDLVQPLSIDEAFLDVTGSIRLLGAPDAIARRIRVRVHESTGGLTCSVGVAWCKFLAKLASDLDKPDGLTVVRRADLEGRIGALPIERMWGIGPASVGRFHGFGIRTLADLHRLDEADVRRRLGDLGVHAWRLARGIDERAVHPDREAKSVGNERTFGENVDDPEVVRAYVVDHAEHVAFRLRKHQRLARTVSIKVRYGDFETITRSITLDRATDRTDDVVAAATGLFEAWASSVFRPVRLIGVTCSNLRAAGDGREVGLFDADDDERRRSLDRVSDAIRAKYGRRGIGRASGGPSTE